MGLGFLYLLSITLMHSMILSFISMSDSVYYILMLCCLCVSLELSTGSSWWHQKSKGRNHSIFLSSTSYCLAVTFALMTSISLWLFQVLLGDISTSGGDGNREPTSWGSSVSFLALCFNPVHTGNSHDSIKLNTKFLEHARALMI